MAIATTITTAKRRSGGNAAPFVVGAIVVAVGLLLSWWASPGRDTIQSLTPRSAHSYLHGEARDAWLIGDEALASLEPDEFAIVDLGASEEPMRVTVVRWRLAPFTDVPEETDAALREMGAWQMGTRGTYALGTQEALQKFFTPLRQGRNALSYEQGRSDALDAVRGAFGVQMLVPGVSEAFPFLADPSAELVIGATVRNDSFRAVVSDRAALSKNAFGFRTPETASRRVTAMTPENAVLTLVPDEASGSAATSIIMSAIDEVRMRVGAPVSTQLEKAGADLAALLVGSSVSFIDNGDSREPIAVLPVTIDADELIDALSLYVAASIPDRRPITLPDGSWTTELVFTDEPTILEAGPRTRRLAERFRSFAETDLLITFADDRIVIATSISGLDAGLEAKPLAENACAGPRVAVPSMILSDAAKFSGIHGRFDAILARTSTKTLVVTPISDSSVKICGYSYP